MKSGFAAVSALTLMSMGAANAAVTSYSFDSATTGAVVAGGAATLSTIALGASSPVPASDAPFSAALVALGISSTTLSSANAARPGGVVNQAGPSNLFDTGWNGAWTINFGGAGVSNFSFLYYETESTIGGSDGFRVDIFNTSLVQIGSSVFFGQGNGLTASFSSVGGIGRAVITDLGSGTFVSSGDGVRVDNLSTDTIASVPEPATYLMIGSALAGMAAFRRRRA